MQIDTSKVLPAQSFVDLLVQAPLPTEKVIDLGLQIAASLEEQAGAMGNLTPEMFSFAEDRVEITPHVSNTPTLLAPEILQKAGSPGSEKDRQLADVWSLGVILYMLLAGHSPFGGITRRQQIAAITSYKPTPDIRNVRPDVPDSLAGMLYHMLQRNVERRSRIPTIDTVRRTLVSIQQNHETPYSLPEFPVVEAKAILKDARERFQAGKGVLSEGEYRLVRHLVDTGELKIAEEYAQLWRKSRRLALGRRLAARLAFSFLLGLGVPAFMTLFDIGFQRPDANFSILLNQAVGALVLVFALNGFSVGIVTITSHLWSSSRPTWWILPLTMSLLTGALLGVLMSLGLTTSYRSLLEALVAGAAAGLIVGGVYTFSMPAQRQDTILKQSRQAVVISLVPGAVYGLYFFLTQYKATMEFYTLAASIIGVPIIIVGLLLSFVLGVELGDRYVER